MRRIVAGIAFGLLAAHLFGAPAPAGAGEVVAPEGYRRDRYRSPTPAGLPGAATVDADRADELARRGALLVDVLPVTVSRLGGGARWLVDEAHLTVPGAVWLPNVGYGTLSPDADAWYRNWLERLAGGDRGRALVLFCKADCWMSWNAARRALSYGYTAVYWFRDGTDGWTESGRPLAAAAPAGPPPDAQSDAGKTASEE